MGIGAAVGAGISAAGSIFGSMESASAAKDAAKIQGQYANRALDLQSQMFGEARNALSPYMQVGAAGAGALGTRLGELTSAIPFPTMTQASLEQTPGYQFTLNQGLKATQNSAAARGLGVSGAAMKGAASYATGLSDQTYNTRFNQAQQQWQDQITNQSNAYNRLYSTAGLGEQAGAALAGNAIQSGQGMANTLTGAGNAQAAGINAAGQATTAGITGVSGAFSNALQNYMVGNALQGKGLYGS